MSAETPLFTRLAAAYVRGALRTDVGASEAPLDSLSADQREALIALGRARGLRLQRFKRTAGPPRVQAVLNMLRTLDPAELLHIGSGRGTFLWPLLDAMPRLPVTAVTPLAQRVAEIQRVVDGGVATLSVTRADLDNLPFADASFDAVTLLEVLGQVNDSAAVLRSVLRVAQRFVIISVSTRVDDENPGPIYSEPQLSDLLRAQGLI
ncbi:MAG: class I SAM-dependent methyltransferase, partial [Oscillochloris sp.]|nr:class I SAM-dependent methyltransferase [Oscillochloris sp.]